MSLPILKQSSSSNSVTQSCPTLCDPTNHSMPGLPVHHQLLEFTQTHITVSFSFSLTVCFPDLPPLVAEFIHCLVDVSQDPKIVPGIQWALKNVHRMHQQILIFTFTSQMLVLHYKSHSSSSIIPFHYFFP